MATGKDLSEILSETRREMRRTPGIRKEEVLTPKGQEGSAALAESGRARQRMRGIRASSRIRPPQTKIDVTLLDPVGSISVVTLIRTDTTLDHSQKAEKV